MPSKTPVGRLEDIFENIERIERFTAGISFEEFMDDEQVFFASLHALLILSEAARKLGDVAFSLVPNQPWTDIRSMGNVLRHEYDGVDPEVIWRVIKTGELASLKQAVGEAIARLRT